MLSMNSLIHKSSLSRTTSRFTNLLTQRLIKSDFFISNNIQKQVRKLLDTQNINLTSSQHSRDLDRLLVTLGTFQLDSQYVDLSEKVLDLNNFTPSKELVDFIILSLQNESIPSDLRKRLLTILLKHLHRGNVSLSDDSLTMLYKNWVHLLTHEDVRFLLNHKSKSREILSLLIHYNTLTQEYDDAINIISRRRSIKIHRFAYELLGYHLIMKRKLDQFHKLTGILYSKGYENIFNQQLLEMWLNAAIDSGRIDLVTSFFNGFIYFFDTPLLVLNDTLVNRITRLSIEKFEFAAFGKVVDYQVTKLRLQNAPQESIDSFKREMTLCRFNGYVNKLGATCVIESGMFSKFSFETSIPAKTSDFPLLVSGLAEVIPNLNLQKCLKLIEQLNGYHIKEYRNRFSKVLHPDEQLYRIHNKSTSENRGSNLASIESEQLASKFPLQSTKLGKPERTSRKFRDQKVKTSVPFTTLPLNIVLKAIEQSTNDLDLAIMITKVIAGKRRCILDSDTFLYLCQMVENNYSSGKMTSIKTQLFDLLASLRGSIRIDAKAYQTIIGMLANGDELEALVQVMDEYREQGFSISKTMYKDLMRVCVKFNDDAYLKFEPADAEK